MAGVFQSDVFQNNVFQVDAGAPGHVFQCNVFLNNVFQGVCGVTPSGGSHLWGLRDTPQRGRRLRRVLAENRKRWDELLNRAEKTQEAALDKAQDLTGEAKESLTDAARAAQAAIDAAREAEAGQAALRSVVAALRRAAAAKTRQDAIVRAIEAERQAKELMARCLEMMAEIDDEEALMLLT
jgi:hypothetical protein